MIVHAINNAEWMYCSIHC